eukprot:15478358-Alexandrium_andersonii.AAC.1
MFWAAVSLHGEAFTLVCMRHGVPEGVAARWRAAARTAAGTGLRRFAALAFGDADEDLAVARRRNARYNERPPPPAPTSWSRD